MAGITSAQIKPLHLYANEMLSMNIDCTPKHLEVKFNNQMFTNSTMEVRE